MYNHYVILQHVVGCFLLLSLTDTTSATVADDDNAKSLCYIMNNQNYCFYTNGSIMSWNESREFCETRDSTLPIIRDENIDNVFQQFVNHSYSEMEDRYVWIDAHARPVQTYNTWHWIDGTQSGC